LESFVTGVRLQDVAAHAGVSMKTVSNVVRDYPHVSSGMRERVQRAIKELGYRPNIMARRLATGRTGVLALAFSDIGLPYFAELARVVARQAQRSGYRVMFEETEGTLEGERGLLASSEAGLVDGILFQPSVMASGEIAKHRTDLPIVLLGEESAPLTFDRVMIDNPAAAEQVTRHLINLGRSRIGFVGHETGKLSQTSRLRISGYQKALEEAGIDVDSRLLIASPDISAVGSATAVGEAFDAGVRFDALVCRDDLAAIGALRALHERGVRIPEDVAVTGWDDIRMSATTFPSLTTVAPNLDALVSRALELLIERIDGYDGMGRHEIVPHHLVVRESAPVKPL
jgi:DNA-binding LacI/PurR family transcriptional regulator